MILSQAVVSGRNESEAMSKDILSAPIGQPDGPSVPILATCPTCGGPMPIGGGRCIQCRADAVLDPSHEFAAAYVGLITDAFYKWGLLDPGGEVQS